MNLIMQINFGFLCPDHEFKSKLTQFMYEELSEVLEFSEETATLNNFLQIADWNYPIALHCFSSVNSINLLTSFACHYNVGLQILRTDP